MDIQTPPPPPQQPSKQEMKVLQAKLARRRSKAIWIAVGAILLLVAGGLLIWFLPGGSGGDQPGVFYEAQGQDHVEIGFPFQYNSNPPTSGPHYKDPADWGVYREEIPDQVLIHNLEHGGIWIAYTPGIDPAIISALEEIAKEYDRKVIMTPRAANDADIAVAAWSRLDKFPVAEFSQDRVHRFIRAYRNRGPEFVP